MATAAIASPLNNLREREGIEEGDGLRAMGYRLENKTFADRLPTQTQRTMNNRASIRKSWTAAAVPVPRPSGL
jgi:hypothetical protein